MTAPDSRPIHDVIAEVIRREIVPLDGRANIPGVLAAAVVAACQGATVAQQAELTDGMTERGTFARVVDGVVVADRVRLVGPWREDPS